LTDLFNELKDATTVFAQVVGGDVRKVMRIIPERPGILEYPHDVSLHPYVSASALLFQSLWTEEERVAYRKRYPFWEYGAHAWGTEKRFDEEMEATRRKGCAMVDIEKTGVYTMAAPVTGVDGQVLAAIGATIPLEKAREKRRRQLVGEVMKAAANLSGQAAENVVKTEPVHPGERGGPC
jgi:DNA-binding IclR family transcriptional regulator